MTKHLPGAPEPTMVSLVGGIVNDVQTLLKQELALARREATDELNKAKEVVILLGIGIGSAALCGLLLVFMLIYLLHWASSERLPLWGCGGIVGAALMILTGGLFLFVKRRAGAVHLMPEHIIALMILAGGRLFFGKETAGAVHLMPEQTIATMKDNVSWIKKQTLARNDPKRSGTTLTKPVTT